MRKQIVVTVAAFGLLSIVPSLAARPVHAQTVFQAAGPDKVSIEGTVKAYQAALGEPINASNPGPLAVGRREINWDGGGATTTTGPDNPMDTFLNSRGARFTTPGVGLSQSPPLGGLEVLFNNPTYADAFKAFSPQRLFTPVGSRITEGVFFVPGANPLCAPPSCPDVPLVSPATVRGFGAIFSDVDNPNGRSLKHDTQIEYFDAAGRRIFIGLVPASPGQATFSFFGIVFEDPRIARVKITTGNSGPGPGPDDDQRDIVMMDDFFYGEPQSLNP